MYVTCILTFQFATFKTVFEILKCEVDGPWQNFASKVTSNFIQIHHFLRPLNGIVFFKTDLENVILLSFAVTISQ